MDVPLLRILTWKSVIGFGQYKYMKIKDIYDLHHTQYLRYIYYNIAGISFIDEILEAIGIIALPSIDYRINKPGTDHEKQLLLDKHKFYQKVYVMGNATHAINNNKLGSKLLRKRTICEENILFSKGNLQRKNQGHKYKH